MLYSLVCNSNASDLLWGALLRSKSVLVSAGVARVTRDSLIEPVWPGFHTGSLFIPINPGPFDDRTKRTRFESSDWPGAYLHANANEAKEFHPLDSSARRLVGQQAHFAAPCLEYGRRG